MTMRGRHLVQRRADSPPRLSSSATTPAELVRGVLESDFRLIRAWLLREMRGDADAAADVMAAFCLRALVRADQIKQPGAVRAWLAKLLRSTLADQRRQAGRQRRFVRIAETQLDDDGHEVIVLAAAALPSGPECECLEIVLGTMPPRDGELIRRVDLEGEARRGVAARLGVSRNALGVRLHRARGTLRDRLRALCDACLAPVDPEPCGCKPPVAPAM
jgi:RNA polymerase sigma factor (sigma-70 family)